MKTHIEEYLKALSASGLADKTIADTKRSLVGFVRSNRIKKADRIFPEHITAYQDLLAEGGLSSNTRRAKLTHVRRFLEFLKEDGLTLIDASSHIVVPKMVPHLPRAALSEEEVSAILKLPILNDPANLRLRAIVELLYGTGIRRGELLNLDLYDLDARARTLLIREGKFRKDRLVPVPRATLRYIAKYIEKERSKLAGDDEALFLSKRRCRMSDNALQSIMRIFARKARKQLGIAKPVTCHVFRHSIATHLLVSGVDIRYIQVFLGHADLTTTEIYTHVEPVHLAEELLRAHPRDRMKIPLNKAE